MENPNLDNIVLALLFASDEALSARKIAALIEDVTVADVKNAIETWNARADAEAWSIGIEQVAGGYRLATRPDYAPYVSRLYAGRRKFRLSRAVTCNTLNAPGDDESSSPTDKEFRAS